MSNESPEAVAERVTAALANATAIDYGGGFPDKQYPEISWFRCGLPDSNEIAVIATVGHLRLGIIGQSRLVYPPMFDRVLYGIDIDDQQLSFALADQLWAVHSERLIAEALRLPRH